MKRKLSELKGLVTRMSGKEIDAQISALRDEWDRRSIEQLIDDAESYLYSIGVKADRLNLTESDYNSLVEFAKKISRQEFSILKEYHGMEVCKIPPDVYFGECALFITSSIASSQKARIETDGYDIFEFGRIFFLKDRFQEFLAYSEFLV